MLVREKRSICRENLLLLPLRRLLQRSDSKLTQTLDTDSCAAEGEALL